jgi:outer membrane protein
VTNRFITFTTYCASCFIYGASCFIALLLPATALAQATEAARERLSLTTAIQLATEHNRQLEASKLQIDKAEDDLAAAKTKRLPLFESTFNASQLLTPVSYSFPKGAFGDLPGIGPFPATNVDVKSSAEPNAFINSQISQPLSQLIRINLGIRGAAANRDIERERNRQQRLAVVNAVSKQYFAILQTTSALTASEEAIALYRELDRTIAVRVVEKVSLKSDAMDVQLRLAQEELTHMTYSNTLASQKEQLNQLLGRDVRTAFDVDDLAPLTPSAIDLDAVQARALQDRPDIREARLKLEQADLDRRMKRSERIPDISLAASYTSNFNMDVLPRNLSAVGVQVKWEPFDWGRKGRELASKTRTVEQAKLGVRDAEDRAVIEINARYRKLAESRALLNVAQLGQTTAREKLRVKTNQFQIQSALLADVLHQRVELAESTDRYQQAMLAFWTAKADFDQAIGEELQ